QGPDLSAGVDERRTVGVAGVAHSDPLPRRELRDLDAVAAVRTAASTLGPGEATQLCGGHPVVHRVHPPPPHSMDVYSGQSDQIIPSHMHMHCGAHIRTHLHARGGMTTRVTAQARRDPGTIMETGPAPAWPGPIPEIGSGSEPGSSGEGTGVVKGLSRRGAADPGTAASPEASGPRR